jgi:1-phosphofructokinase family hexose kinase
MILCVTPNPALDRLLTAAGYRTLDVVRVRESAALAGGKGNNVARAIRTLSPQTPVVCAGFLGGATGRQVADLAKREGLGAAWTWIEGETRTCTILIDPDLGASTAVNEAGPEVSVEDWARFEADVLRAAQPARWVCFSGSLPPRSPLAAFTRLIERLMAAQRRVLVDTSGSALTAALAAHPTAIKVNLEEANEIVQGGAQEVDSAITVAGELLRQHQLQFAVLTMGARGAVWVTAEQCWQSASPPIHATNTVASGDAFLGGMMAALLADAPLNEALCHAVAAGAANAASRGGARFSRSDFDALLRNCAASRHG